MKSSNTRFNFTVSHDPKHQYFAGIIRNRVLAEEFNLQHVDFTHDQFDTGDNAIYLLANNQCVGCCRVIARRDSGALPVEDYLDLGQAFGLSSKPQLDTTAEFSRLAILPEYQGAKGASLLVAAVAEYAVTRGLSNIVYCSDARRLAVFSSIAQRKDLCVQTSETEFRYAGVQHATFSAALVRLDLHADGRERYARNVG